MRLIKLLTVCLLVLEFAGAAHADAEYEALVKEYNNRTYPRPIPTPKYSYDITAHSNCVLENGKNARTPRVSNEISTACRHKATPKKCRDVSAMLPDNESKSPQEICVEECRSAGMWSRKYGDCSLD